MEVQKLSAIIPVTLEQAIFDGLVEDGPFLEQLKAKYAAERAEEKRRWRALPWYVRSYRTAISWKWRYTYRAKNWLHSRLFPECDS